MQPDFRHAKVRVLDNLVDVGTLMLRLDPRRLQQVLLNLLLNALQAMPEGGQLRVQVRVEGAKVQLRVEDEGVGIDPAVRAHLFEAFHTSKEKGSGLGLHMAQRIAEQHGGSLRLVSGAGGRGATAVLELPRRGPNGS
jgi:signal transduction histidine kinase